MRIKKLISLLTMVLEEEGNVPVILLDYNSQGDIEYNHIDFLLVKEDIKVKHNITLKFKTEKKAVAIY